jgi:DNA-binding transcriptional LysR family regulator
VTDGPRTDAGAELRHLRCFVAAAEEGSFSAGARRLYVSQQSLSRTIAQLERRADARLFERSGRTVELTPAGQALLPAARRALAAAGEAVEIARRTAAGDDSTPLRVDISSGGIETGALILRRLRREHPEIAVRQVEVGVARGIDLLRAGELDVLLGLAIAAPDEVRTEPIRRERMLVGMSAGHPLASHDEVPVSALAEVKLLLPADHAAGEWNAFVEDHCRRAGVNPQRFDGVTHGSVSAAEIVREGGCVVPTMAWTEPPVGIVFRPVVSPPALFPWSMMWSAGAEDRAGTRAFLETSRRLAKELGWLLHT